MDAPTEARSGAPVESGAEPRWRLEAQHRWRHDGERGDGR
jgi:hypothetical protein